MENMNFFPHKPEEIYLLSSLCLLVLMKGTSGLLERTWTLASDIPDLLEFYFSTFVNPRPTVNHFNFLSPQIVLYSRGCRIGVTVLCIEIAAQFTGQVQNENKTPCLKNMTDHRMIVAELSVKCDSHLGYDTCSIGE